jgi:phage-related protein
VRDEAGAFRIIYLATRPDGVYVLHCFQKEDATDESFGHRASDQAIQCDCQVKL